METFSEFVLKESLDYHVKQKDRHQEAAAKHEKAYHAAIKAKKYDKAKKHRKLADRAKDAHDRHHGHAVKLAAKLGIHK